MKQKTLKKEVSTKGLGLFSGIESTITLCPEVENTGIWFRRVDLPNKPKLLASLANVKDTPRCTILGNNLMSIMTVEHLLSALAAYEIDNLIIDINGPEVPSGDGSAQVFIDLIEKAEVIIQNDQKKIIEITKPIYFSLNDIHLVALPSNEYKISYLLHYPESTVLKSQYFNLNVTSQNYKKEIASCRTFSVYEEIKPLLDKGLIKGGGLNNAVIIKDDKIMNEGGIRFPEEMARHKILDLIGDLSLLGGKIKAHIMAVRSGHFSNVAFGKEILKNVGEEK